MPISPPPARRVTQGGSCQRGPAVKDKHGTSTITGKNTCKPDRLSVGVNPGKTCTTEDNDNGLIVNKSTSDQQLLDKVGDDFKRSIPSSILRPIDRCASAPAF